MIFKRRLVREKVLQILYSYELNKESLEFIREELLAEINEKTDLEFANKLIDSTITHLDELDANIKSKVNNWELNRIALIDKILLRMGICEILFFPDIPPKVSINETIEVAKTFSTAGSSKFINGILDAILSDLKKSGTLNKTGRGLIENNTILKNIKQTN
jgi:N utilization substance protein B